MAKIKIQNIGPITDVEIELNKVNVIMGPQSSGKSTIAKLISYCQWVEKRYLLDGEYKEDVRKQLLKFHRLSENYFNEQSLFEPGQSFFEYESDFIKISYTGKKLTKTITVNEDKISDYKKTKNIYIPAERNFVSVIPNLGRYNETNDNIMSFLYDWFSVKEESYIQNLAVLNLNVNYYYNKRNSLDMLSLENGKKIPLRTGSSGLQSVVPLILMIEYLTNNIFDVETALSVKEDNYFSSLKEKYKITDNNEIAKLYKKRSFYNSTNFIIEEPEQNLFPSTQRDLIYYILGKLQSGRDHSLTITTHSPYILYALNNCILGKVVYDKMSEEDKKRVNFQSALITPEKVSIYEIHEGTLKLIQQEDGLIGSNYFDQNMREVMDDFYVFLKYCDDEE